MEIIKTTDVASEAELRDFYAMEPDDRVEDVIETHDGEWRYDGEISRWRFWRYPE